MAEIKFYYDKDDLTLETINKNNITLTQGQADSIYFDFYFGSVDINDFFTNELNQVFMLDNPCLLNIERSDGSSSNNVATTPIVSNVNDLHYQLLINDWVTGKAGDLKITAKLYNPITEVTTTYGLATIQILPSAEVSTDTIEDLQYQALVSYLATSGINRYQVVADGSITKLDLVMFSGTVGGSGKIKVKKANSSIISEHPEYVFGISLEDAVNNEEFYVQTEGFIRDVDTTDFEEEKVLVPSATIDGALIEYDNANAPKPPKNRMPIAVCVYSHKNNGILLVRPTFFPDMSHIQDVDIDKTQMTQGQGLIWDNTNKKFIAGFSGGVFYDDNLPRYDERFNNLTWFDEGPQGINTWVLPTVYWQPYVLSASILHIQRTLIDSYGAFRKVTKMEILNTSLQPLIEATNQDLINVEDFYWQYPWTNILVNYGVYYLRVTFEYENQDGISVQDIRLAQFQFIYLII